MRKAKNQIGWKLDFAVEQNSRALPMRFEIKLRPISHLSLFVIGKVLIEGSKRLNAKLAATTIRKAEKLECLTDQG